MTTKQVTRYQCDYCRKKGYSAAHMAKHERHCTLNPQRVCRVCKMVEGEQRPIGELLALLPVHPRAYYEGFQDEDGCVQPQGQDEVLLALPALKQACGGCPACVMAALRQARIPVWMAGPTFDFTKEMKALWEGINEAKVEASNYGY